MSTAIDEGEDQQEISAGAFEIFGQKLGPFSFDRQAAAQRLMDDSGAENDVLLIYLCLTPAPEVLLLRGEDRVAAFRSKMGLWADKNSVTIHADNPARKEISRIANQIYGDLAKASFEFERSAGEKPPDPNITG